MLNNCDDSVLLLHRQTVMAHKRPYSLLQRARRRLQMLNDCDDGVLLLRRGAVMTQMRPCNPYSKECGEGCRCYMIATMAYF